MFSKTKSEDHKPYEAPRREGALTGKHRSVLHDGVTINGDWTSDGVVEFGGILIGDLTAEAIVLTKTGKVQGNVRAHHVIVEGALTGTISAEQVVIKPQSKVAADITARILEIASGSEINGRLTIKSNERQPSGSAVE